MSVLFNGTIFRFHVHLQGCIFPELIFLFQKSHKPCIQFDEASSKFLCHRLRYASGAPENCPFFRPLASPPTWHVEPKSFNFSSTLLAAISKKKYQSPVFLRRKSFPIRKSSWINKKTASNLELLAFLKSLQMSLLSVLLNLSHQSISSSSHLIISSSNHLILLSSHHLISPKLSLDFLSLPSPSSEPVAKSLWLRWLSCCVSWFSEWLVGWLDDFFVG